MSTLPRDDVGFIGDITYPDNSMVNINESFDKIWEIQNIGKMTWKNRRVVCVDDELQTMYSDECGLRCEFQTLELPMVKPDEHVKITIPFIAPSYPCTVISHWKMVDENGDFCFSDNHPLSCCVKVISF